MCPADSLRTDRHPAKQVEDGIFYLHNYTVATLELYVTLDDHVYLHVKLTHVSRTDYLVYPCFE